MYLLTWGRKKGATPKKKKAKVPKTTATKADIIKPLKTVTNDETQQPSTGSIPPAGKGKSQPVQRENDEN
jgi:hypothetical protein